VQSIKTPLVGRATLYNVSTSATGTLVGQSTGLSPINVSDRPAVVAGAFIRYRISWIRFSWKSRLPSTVAGKFYMGVSDDDVALATTADQVLNYRCSRECDVWKDCSLMYTPVDKKRWAYCRVEGSADARLIQFASFTLVGDGNPLGVFEAPATGSAVLAPLAAQVVGTVDIEYSYVFDGATNVPD